MTDSDSFTSLFDLVDSHLSKTSVTGTNWDNAGGSANSVISPFNEVPGMSDTWIQPQPRFSVPTLSTNETPIQSVLREQVLNMFKAKELKRLEEERQKLETDMEKLKLADEYVIDLTQAIQKPSGICLDVIDSPKQQEPSTCTDSFYPFFLHTPDFLEKANEPPMLPLQTDMSSILFQKIKGKRCSAFGKVLAARYRKVPMPYLRVNNESSIKRFDFKGKSPCDLAKESPPIKRYSNYYYDLLQEMRKDLDDSKSQ